MGKKVYVGNLPFSVTSEGLQGLFTPFGAVESAEVIADRYSGRSKGFGFVEMATEEEAKAAIDKLNGTEHEGRTLTVNEARPMEKRERREGGFGGGGGGGGRGGRERGRGGFGGGGYGGGGGGRQRW